MKKIMILLSGIVCLIHLSSCNDFLTVKPTDSAEASSSITAQRDAKIMMDGLMRFVIGQDYYGRNMLLYGDARGGDYCVFSLGRSGGMDVLYTFGHSTPSNGFAGYWTRIYICMIQVNNILENIARLEDEGNSSESLLAYKGQALTLRALFHFDLARLYGYPYTKDNGASLGAPIVTQMLGVYETPVRSTVAEMYAQVIKDLNDGAPFLGKTKSLGYVNYWANKALLARVYLYMGRYAEALAAAEEVIGTNVYSLYTNDNWVGSWAAQNGTESIFELGIYQSQGDLGSGSLAYTLLRRTVNNTLGQFLASDYFLELLSEDPTDIRWGIMDYDEMDARFPADPGPSVFYPTRLGCCNKYTGGSTRLGDKGSISAVNVKVIRLSEVYLIAAEAALPTDKAKAANYLQAIRQRSPELDPATAENITIDMILNERRKELFGEGHTFFDKMRLNRTITFNDEILQGGIAGNREKSINWDFYRIVLPIPKAEIDANPAIATQQNPGY